MRYDSRQYPGDLPAFIELKQMTRLPPALRDDDFEYCTSFLVAFFGSTSKPDEHKANLLFTIEEVKFSPEKIWVCEAYHYPEERIVDSLGGSPFWIASAARNKDVLGAALSARRAAENVYRGCAALPGLETFARAPGNVF